RTTLAEPPPRLARHPPPPSTLRPYTTLFRSLRLSARSRARLRGAGGAARRARRLRGGAFRGPHAHRQRGQGDGGGDHRAQVEAADRKSTRLNSSHVKISYAVFCLKKKRSDAM